MFEPENVFSGVDVTVVNRAAGAALPFSHSKVFQSSRAADASAVGTDLGSQPLTSLFVLHPVPSGFVAELAPKERPAGVEHGFCHPRLYQLSGTDVADDDTAIRSHKPRRFNMKIMFSGGGDLAMNSSRVPLATSALRPGEHGGAARQMPHICDPAAIRAGDEVLEPKIKTNSVAIFPVGFFDPDLKT